MGDCGFNSVNPHNNDSRKVLNSQHFFDVRMAQPAKMSRYEKVGNAVYTSGVTGKPGDVPTQIRNVFEKLKSILEEAGTSFDKVVKANIYLSDLNYREQYLNDIWNEYFSQSSAPPSRTTVEAGLGPDVYVEIEMVASG
jgi:2-iminobutanoate/2-iminopropanoate deaminase